MNAGSRRVLGLLVPLERSGDRRDAPWWRLLAVAALAAASLGLAASAISVAGPTDLLVTVAAAMGVLVVIGLPSVPLSRAAWSVAFAGGLVVALLGGSSGRGPLGIGVTVSWVAVTVALVALASGRGRTSAPVRTAVAATALVLAATLVLGPTLSSAFDGDPRLTEALDQLSPPPEPSGPSPLDAPRLDASTRPRPSDEVVMSVRAARPALWRTSTLDRWNGRTWTRSDLRVEPLPVDGQVRPIPPFDPPVPDPITLRQEFRIEAPSASVLPAAASAQRVRTFADLGRFADGTLVVLDGRLPRASTYTVVSARPRASVAELTEAGTLPVPPIVRVAYAAPPSTTERVRAVAAELGRAADARAAAAGRPRSSLDVVEEIERYLGRTVRYSLEAPVAPPGTDVVDHFLFESRVGWCEQVASAMAVLARLNGVPTRVATGFTPGRYDAGSDRWVVRARDAHAWTEVYVDRIGWLTFDPTTRVSPLGEVTGDADEQAGGGLGRIVVVLAVVAALALLARPLLLLVRRAGRWAGTRAAEASERRRLPHAAWDVRAERDLEERGRAAGRPRRPDETVTRYAEVVAEVVEEPELVGVGTRIHAARFATPGTREPERSEPG